MKEAFDLLGKGHGVWTEIHPCVKTLREIAKGISTKKCLHKLKKGKESASTDLKSIDILTIAEGMVSMNDHCNSDLENKVRDIFTRYHRAKLLNQKILQWINLTREIVEQGSESSDGFRNHATLFAVRSPHNSAPQQFSYKPDNEIDGNIWTIILDEVTQEGNQISSGFKIQLIQAAVHGCAREPSTVSNSSYSCQ